MGKVTGVFVITLMLVGTMLVTTRIPVGFAASQTDINTAIEKGLTYLNSTQASDGRWSPSWYSVASTSMAVLAYENAPNNHFGWNQSDPYHTTVQKGLNWLFGSAFVQSIGVQTAGNPDSNGNGIGIYFSSGQAIYETPMVLMAIVASQAPTNVTTTGPANVVGRTYHDIAVDIVDYLAWAQNEGPTGRGGWRYGPNYGNSDNSLSQWPVLGLMAAELWGINAPAWVKSELLNYWATTDQNLDGTYSTNNFYGSFGYTNKNELNSIAETAAGIMELTYCGVPKTDPRIIAAQGYIVRDWSTSSGWRVNLGNFYAMYAVMKAARLALPTPIKFIANYTGSPTIEWYNGTNQYADQLVTHQYADGHWNQWVTPESVGTDLSTAWAVLILEFVPVKVQYNLTVHVIDVSTNNPISGADVKAEGPETHQGTTNASGAVAFNQIQAGVYNVSAIKAGFESANATVNLFANSEVTLKLTPIKPTEIVATIDIKPDSLNLRSKGRWITAYIELPEGYDLADINITTIRLNGTIRAAKRPTAIGDYDCDGIPDLMVKFSRAEVERLILNSIGRTKRFVKVTLTVTGSLFDGTQFKGSDIIKTIWHPHWHLYWHHHCR